MGAGEMGESQGLGKEWVQERGSLPMVCCCRRAGEFGGTMAGCWQRSGGAQALLSPAGVNVCPAAGWFLLLNMPACAHRHCARGDMVGKPEMGALQTRG